MKLTEFHVGCGRHRTREYEIISAPDAVTAVRKFYKERHKMDNLPTEVRVEFNPGDPDAEPEYWIGRSVLWASVVSTYLPSVEAPRPRSSSGRPLPPSDREKPMPKEDDPIQLEILSTLKEIAKNTKPKSLPTTLTLDELLE